MYLQLPADEELVQDVVRLVEVEDDVQLADVPEVAVQHLHKQMDLLERDELVVVSVDARHEKQRRVPVIFLGGREGRSGAEWGGRTHVLHALLLFIVT